MAIEMSRDKVPLMRNILCVFFVEGYMPNFLPCFKFFAGGNEFSQSTLLAFF